MLGGDLREDFLVTWIGTWGKRREDDVIRRMPAFGFVCGDCGAWSMG